jgi:hypothetical protein
MVDPPLDADAVQDTTELALAFEVAFTDVGAEATVAGVTLLEAAEFALFPAVLVAITVKVYGVPAVRPDVTVHEVADGPATVQVPPAGLEVAV